MRGSRAPTEAGTKMRPASIAAEAIVSNTAAGAASTTMSASASAVQRDDARRRAEPLQIGLRLGLVARRHGDEPQPIHAGIQRARQLEADRAEAADRDRLRHFFALRDGARRRQVLRRVDVEERVPFRNRKINPAHADPAGEVRHIAPAGRRQQLPQVVAARDRPERHQVVRAPVARRAGGRGSERRSQPGGNERRIAGHGQQRLGAQASGPVQAGQHARERPFPGELAVAQHRQSQARRSARDRRWR